MSRVFNFSAGPAVLPKEVLEQTKLDLINYRETGIGISEISHRSQEFEELMQQTESLFRSLLDIPDSHAVLFITGGGTQQFSMIPMNLIAPGTIANYIVSGEWAKRAFEEAKKFGQVHLAASSEDKNFSYIPKTISLSKTPCYLHYTSNNTIYGTQFASEPEVIDENGNAVPLICDASSDLFHKPIAINKYSLIYAAAQKNFGPAGISAVIIKKELLRVSSETLPIMLNYNTYAKNKSLYNTPPTLTIYMICEVLKWLEAQGGVKEIHKRNIKKASIVYEALDRNNLYMPHAEKSSRSLMNITFHLPSEELDKKFISEAAKQNLKSLAGYRAFGGIRASIYNACPEEACYKLAEFIDAFPKMHA
jgi:phosphoserine aminotransferase